MRVVGARGLVHGLQFNGKQGGAPQRAPNLRCPRNGKQTDRHTAVPLSSQEPLVALKQAAGKVMKVASASPDTGQHGGAPQGCAVSPSTVGEGGEGV